MLELPCGECGEQQRRVVWGLQGSVDHGHGYLGVRPNAVLIDGALDGTSHVGKSGGSLAQDEAVRLVPAACVEDALPVKRDLEQERQC